MHLQNPGTSSAFGGERGGGRADQRRILHVNGFAAGVPFGKKGPRIIIHTMRKPMIPGAGAHVDSDAERLQRALRSILTRGASRITFKKTFKRHFSGTFEHRGRQTGRRESGGPLGKGMDEVP